VHHTDIAMDVTTTFRNHPVEMALRPLFLAVAVVAFGVPPLAVLIQPLLQLPVLVFQHANVKLPPALERVLSWLIVTPGMHLVHHSRTEPETNSNYATWISVWDTLFLTREHASPAALGLDGHDTARHQTLFGMLATPWR
jgi:sterol desaturase/sphingolipid hydroxylase (fatty acid hydroxylase superfamily)